MLFVLAPATRWGYFVYPVGLGCWLWLCGFPAAPVTVPDYPEREVALPAPHPCACSGGVRRG